MVKPATELAVAGALLCFIAANPAGIAFDSLARRGHSFRLGRRGTAGVEPTIADLQTDSLTQKRRAKRWFRHRPHYHRTTILIWPESWPRGRRPPTRSAAQCSR
jgi:hypothetical protein